MSAVEHEGLGDRLLARGQLHSAYLHYQKALQLAPDNIGLEYKKGLALLKAGKAQEAIKQFKLVPADNPLHALACEGMGQAYLIQKNFSTSRTYFKKAVSLDKTLWLSHNYLGAIYDRQRQWADALKSYRTAIELRPHEGSIYNNLGMSYLMATQYDSAVTAFQEALSRGFNPPRVYNNLGVALAHLGYADAALEAFGKAGGQARAYNNLGCIYLEKRQLIKAIACFEKAIAADPVYYVKASVNLKRAKLASEKI
jgi:Flp pilus assembly protein TadD